MCIENGPNGPKSINGNLKKQELKLKKASKNQELKLKKKASMET
jgi:hypothetical protein